MAVISCCQEENEHSELATRTLISARSRVAENPLTALLNRLLGRYGTQDALASAIGVTGSRLNKVLKGDSGGFGVLNCLRLAKVAGLPVSQVLRMAGKHAEADLIEESYGKVPEGPTSVDDAAKQWWPDLSPKATDALQTLLDELTAKRKQKKTRAKSKK